MGNICQTEAEPDKSLSIKNDNAVAVQQDLKPTKNFTSALDQGPPQQQPEKKEVKQPLTNDTDPKPPVEQKKKIKKKKKLKKRKRNINDYADAFSVKDTEQMKKNRAVRLIQNMFREWKKRKEAEANKGWFF